MPAYASARDALAALTRYVDDFPEPGVTFVDLTPVLADADGYRAIIDDLVAVAQASGAELIAGLDARGFLLGAAVAAKMDMGILAVRKQGKLPPPVHSIEYQLEYGSACLEVPAEGIALEGRKVLIVDDVLATGGTTAAAVELLKLCGSEVTGIVVVLEVAELGGRDKVAPIPVTVIGE